MKKKFMLVMAAVMVAIMILACAGAGNASKGESKIKGKSGLQQYASDLQFLSLQLRTERSYSV